MPGSAPRLRLQSIWVNVADDPECCTSIVPAQVKRGDWTLAISTGGASPALARKLRQELQQRFGPEYGPYLALLKGVRTRLLSERRGRPENAALFHQLVASPLLEAVAQGRPGPGGGRAPGDPGRRPEPPGPGGAHERALRDPEGTSPSHFRTGSSVFLILLRSFSWGNNHPPFLKGFRRD